MSDQESEAETKKKEKEREAGPSRSWSRVLSIVQAQVEQPNVEPWRPPKRETGESAIRTDTSRLNCFANYQLCLR